MENKTTILVVEDDDDFREIIREYLGERFDAQIVLAESAHVALKLIDDGLQPNVLITDFRMPGLTGIEMARQLIERGVQVPLIFLTGAEQPKLAHEVFKLGSFDFVRKPIDASFQEAVRNAIAIGRLKWSSVQIKKAQ